MAHHKAFSKQRWSASLKYELALFCQKQEEHATINSLIQQVKQRYMSLIQMNLPKLKEDSQILELGCGPTCISQFIEGGKKTYLDPLLDNFRRSCPGSLPKGTFIAEMAEEIHEPDASYDLILCLKTISHVQNPELVLHEVERLLKRDGVFMISVELWPAFFAKLHYFTARLFPQRILKNRLYCYTELGMENTLRRHFKIQFNQYISTTQGVSLKKECLYVCTHLRDQA